MPYDMTNKSAGDEISSTYEGRHIEMTESLLTHPSHSDGFVDKGDPVILGKQVGVAFRDASAAGDLIAIDTEGIWALSVVAADQNGNSAVARGDRIYINTTTAVLSKISTPATNMPFGIALSTLTSGSTGVVAVKVHQDPETMGEIALLTSEELDHAAFTDGGGTSGYIDITAGQLPARSLVLGTAVNVTEGFAGDTTAIVSVGVSGDTDRFSSVTDQSVLAIGRVAMGIPTDGQDGFAAAQTVRVTVTGSADWGNVTAGKMFVTLYYIPLA
jgi:predicted RecA/RadA family phage recombinase